MNCDFYDDGSGVLVCSRDGCGIRAKVIPGKSRVLAECRGFPHPHELGHWLTLVLEACFIRKRDFLWLKAKLGLAPKCGCGKREAVLNTWGDRVRGWLKKKPDPDQEARP